MVGISWVTKMTLVRMMVNLAAQARLKNVSQDDVFMQVITEKENILGENTNTSCTKEHIDEKESQGYPANSHHDKFPPWWEFVRDDYGGILSPDKFPPLMIMMKNYKMNTLKIFLEFCFHF